MEQDHDDLMTLDDAWWCLMTVDYAWFLLWIGKLEKTYTNWYSCPIAKEEILECHNFLLH